MKEKNIIRYVVLKYWHYSLGVVWRQMALNYLER